MASQPTSGALLRAGIPRFVFRPGCHGLNSTPPTWARRAGDRLRTTRGTRQATLIGERSRPVRSRHRAFGAGAVGAPGAGAGETSPSAGLTPGYSIFWFKIG